MKKTNAIRLSIICFAIAASSAFADVQVWDPNGATEGCNATGGTWDTTTSNWASSCDAGDNAQWVNGNDAVFNVGTTYTTTMSGDVTVRNLTLVGTAGGPYVFAGSRLIFGNDAMVDTGNRILTMSGVHHSEPTVVLTKTGAGTVALGNTANTFGGKYLVVAGRLSFSSDRQLGPVPAAVVPDYITLTNGGFLRTTSVGATLNANRGITMAGNGGWEISAAVTNIINSRITGTGNLTLNTVAGAVFVIGNTGNNYSGSTTIGAGGVVRLGASEVIPHAANVNVTVNGTLDFNGFNETLRALAGSGTVLMGTNNMGLNRSSGNATFSGVISGSGNITKTGAGTQTLTGDNTFTSRLLINAGKIAVAKDSALGASPASLVTNKITFGGGTLRTTAAFTLDPNRGISITSNGTWEHAEVSEITYDGVISGAGNFIKSGIDGSVLVLNSANTYAGSTTVSGGTLRLGNANGIPVSALAVNGETSSFDLNNFDISLTALSGSGTVMSSGGLGSISIVNGRLAAGTSLTANVAGLLTLQRNLNLTDSTNRWELAALTDDSDGFPGTDFDQVVFTGGELALQNTIISIGFTNNSLAPDFANPFWQTTRKWTVIKMNGGSNPTASNFVSVQTNTFYHAGTFSTAVEPDGSISLTFTPSGPTAPIIITQPQNLSGVEGSNVTFTVNATGTAPLSYQWYFNDSTPVPDATDSSLTLSNLQTADAGNYKVIVSNNLNTATSDNASLTVIIPAAISEQPQNQTVEEGGTATFTVTATGTAPTYQWKFNTTNIVGATSASLTISNVALSNAGNYSVLVTNLGASVLSSNALLTVTEAPLSPVVSISKNNQIVTLEWTSVAGRDYRAQYRTNLNVTNWVDLVPDVSATGSTSSITNDAGTDPERYYRILLLPFQP